MTVSSSPRPSRAAPDAVSGRMTAHPAASSRSIRMPGSWSGELTLAYPILSITVSHPV